MLGPVDHMGLSTPLTKAGPTGFSFLKKIFIFIQLQLQLASLSCGICNLGTVKSSTDYWTCDDTDPGGKGHNARISVFYNVHGEGGAGGGEKKLSKYKERNSEREQKRGMGGERNGWGDRESRATSILNMVSVFDSRTPWDWQYFLFLGSLIHTTVSFQQFLI